MPYAEPGMIFHGLSNPEQSVDVAAPLDRPIMVLLFNGVVVCSVVDFVAADEVDVMVVVDVDIEVSSVVLFCIG